MKVKALVEILQRYDQDAEIIIAESQYDNDNVLVVMEDPSNPDDTVKNPEIRFN